jgi:TonB-dependent SusC/RagA subfamily outer membrane receptor
MIYAQQSPFSIPKIKDSATKAIDTKDESGNDAFMVKAEQRSKYDEDIRVIHLNVVEVTAPRIEKEEEPRLQYWANISSDFTIRREEFEKRHPVLVADILRGVPGIGGRPLVLIDGVPVDWPPPDLRRIMTPYESPLETVSVHDVESIDVFKYASAAAFGVRGTNGVISITTRRGIDVIREVESWREKEALNYTVYTPLGYQKPVEFYAPRYETLEAKHLTIPDYRTTIFWKPDIVISDGGEATFDFYTSDFSTSYSVVIEGITTDGRIIRQVEKIRVE